MSIITNRIKNDLYSSFPASQAAYQPGRGTIEQILGVQQLIEKSVEFNHPLHIVFIDFTKSFDSVDQREIWRALDKTCKNKCYIKLLKVLSPIKMPPLKPMSLLRSYVELNKATF